MQRSGWTSGKSGDFSAFRAAPIRRQTSLLLRNTTLWRERVKSNVCHLMDAQLPLISFQRPSPGSAEAGANPISSFHAVASCFHGQHSRHNNET
jgi:hypothetical protein